MSKKKRVTNVVMIDSSDEENQSPIKKKGKVGRPSVKAKAITKSKAKINLVTSSSEESDEESPVKQKKRKISKHKKQDSDDEAIQKKKQKKNDKQDAVMVIYDIDDTMPELQLTYNRKSGTLLLSDLFDLNPHVKRSDVSPNLNAFNLFSNELT